MAHQKFPPVIAGFNHFLHGGDYNPEQWKETPEIWDKDFEMFKKAGINTATVGVFSWSDLEITEGVFDFSWLDIIMDKLAENGMKAVLATPSGARPRWLSEKYPEVLRVSSDLTRSHFGYRHNHCFTSPVYREKTAIINEKLAERYKNHPALGLWHVSNELSGECHCPLCQEAFREWLKNKYHSLDNLNRAYWASFWSHRYTSWNQVESPNSKTEKNIHGLNLDWKRFVTDQTISFFKNEIEPLKRLTPNIPVTANLMNTYAGLNYQKLARVLDVVSWDSYPVWHSGEHSEIEESVRTGFMHDIYRSLKGKPFLLMESTPSLVNWHEINRAKRPGMHKLSSLQAVAHGSDSVQYFQLRAGRGGSEKFHGAVIGHSGRDDTRVFRDVSALGALLPKLDEIVGTGVDAKVAIVYDWENRWAVEDAAGFIKNNKKYLEECMKHYRYFFERGIPCDIIPYEAANASATKKYKLIVAPMLYKVSLERAKQLTGYVASGGTMVLTYLSSVVNDIDLCHLGGAPGPLTQLCGLRVSETDCLFPNQKNSLIMNQDAPFDGTFEAYDFCDVVELTTAEPLAMYGKDFYKGTPAVTVNKLFYGEAYYLAARTERRFDKAFYDYLTAKLDIQEVTGTILPDGVSAMERGDGENSYLFLLNFSAEDRFVEICGEYTDMENGMKVSENIGLCGFGAKILKKL